MDDNSTKISNIDVNSSDFYEEVHVEIESDLARMKRSIEVLLDLRLTAAEVEVETAALYHAELWHDVLNMDDSAEITSDEEDDVAEVTPAQESHMDTSESQSNKQISPMDTSEFQLNQQKSSMDTSEFQLNKKKSPMDTSEFQLNKQAYQLGKQVSQLNIQESQLDKQEFQLDKQD